MIIHLVENDSTHRARYLCNWAVTPRFDKIANSEREVTCKNCKRILKRINKNNVW